MLIQVPNFYMNSYYYKVSLDLIYCYYFLFRNMKPNTVSRTLSSLSKQLLTSHRLDRIKQYFHPTKT